MEKYGYDMAVLAGDKLFIYAFETAAKAFALTDRADLVGKLFRFWQIRLEFME